MYAGRHVTDELFPKVIRHSVQLKIPVTTVPLTSSRGWLR
jgi:hypothetical protein